jgi:O-antigen biosynthesis protein
LSSIAPLGPAAERIVPDGKFLRCGEQRFLVKGVAYGTFAPNGDRGQFPTRERAAEDFALMAGAGINTVRLYSLPPVDLLDEMARHGLRAMVGVPWSQHIAFLDDRALTLDIRRTVRDAVQSLASHPAVLVFALGNEISPGVVRWHGPERVERFLRELYDDCKATAPGSLLTYANYPPTEYLDLEFFDVCAFNVYLHREKQLRSYLDRLQHVAGNRPLLLAEAGGDSIREGEDGQAALTGMQLRAAFEAGLCGAIAFSWTDEWWRGGAAISDWAFGLVDAERCPKPVLAKVTRVFASAPFDDEQRRNWPKVSVVVCAHNAEDTIEECLVSLEQLRYPDVEVIVIDDGSRDATREIVRRHPFAALEEVSHCGLSAARNVGLGRATGDIVAYTDADVRVDPDWLTFLIQPFVSSDAVGVGGPNAVPADDPWMAQCVARAPGRPNCVLLDDRTAEHIPGCNMAFRRDALLAIGGFMPIFLRAGDDVDVCWRLQREGGWLAYSPSALVWHRHRTSVRGYWKQQLGYGEGETWLKGVHPEKFSGRQAVWHGRIYSQLPFVRSLFRTEVDTGVWGTAAFPSIYQLDTGFFAYLPHTARWLVLSLVLVLDGVLASFFGSPRLAYALGAVGGLGLATTVGKCIWHAWRTNLDGLSRAGHDAARGHRVRCRAMIAWLHLIQPLARMHGRIRGLMVRPSIDTHVDPHSPRRSLPTPSWADTWMALRLFVGARLERRFWSESWMDAGALLAGLTDWLRMSRIASRIAIDSGWSPHQDMSVDVGRWGHLILTVLCEDHGGGRCLHRVATQFRLTAFGGVMIGAVAVVWGTAVFQWPQVSLAVLAGGVAVALLAHWQLARTVAVARRAIAVVTRQAGLLGMAPTDASGAVGTADEDDRVTPRVSPAHASLRTGGDEEPGHDGANEVPRAAAAR